MKAVLVALAISGASAFTPKVRAPTTEKPAPGRAPRFRWPSRFSISATGNQIRQRTTSRPPRPHTTRGRAAARSRARRATSHQSSPRAATLSSSCSTPSNSPPSPPPDPWPPRAHASDHGRESGRRRRCRQGREPGGHRRCQRGYVTLRRVPRRARSIAKLPPSHATASTDSTRPSPP